MLVLRKPPHFFIKNFSKLKRYFYLDKVTIIPFEFDRVYLVSTVGCYVYYIGRCSKKLKKLMEFKRYYEFAEIFFACYLIVKL